MYAMHKRLLGMCMICIKIQQRQIQQEEYHFMTVQERQRLTQQLFIDLRKRIPKIIDKLENECLGLCATKGGKDQGKGNEYAGRKDTLAYFKRNAKKAGLTKYEVLLIFKLKHSDAIASAIRRNPTFPETISESLHGRILDDTAYNILLRCMLEEDSRQ